MMNVDEIYNHRACERCHTQKLRCRPQSEDICIRCAKANTKCVARPPRRVRRTENPPKRRSKAEKAQLPAASKVTKHVNEVDESDKASNGADTRSASMNLMDWSTETDLSSLDFSDIGASNHNSAELAGSTATFSDGFIENAWTDLKLHCGAYFPPQDYSNEASSPIQSKESPVDMLSTEGISDYSTFSKEDWVEDLSRLNSRVSKHDEAIIGNGEDQSAGTSPSSEFSPISNDSSPLAGKESWYLDETLALTTDLIRLLEQLSSHTSDRPRNEILAVNGFQPGFQQHSVDRPRQHSGFITPPAEGQKMQSPIRGDQFTLLLLMSCYMRLLGIYESFFRHLQSTLGDSKSHADPSSPTQLHLPSITVGSFSLHSTPSLKVPLIIELVSFLVGHLGHTVDIEAPPIAPPVSASGKAFLSAEKSSKSNNAMTEVVTSMHNAVKEREKDLADTMGRIRMALMRSRLGVSFGGGISSYS